MKLHAFFVVTTLFTASQKTASQESVTSEVNQFLPESVPLIEHFKSTCRLDITARPVIQDNSPVHINISLHSYKLREISERKQTFTVQAAVILKWQHPCVHWENSTKWAKTSVRSFRLKAADVWHPSIFHWSSHDDFSIINNRAEKRYAFFHSNGIVVLMVYVTLTAHCEFNLQKFPFDEQTCRIELGPEESTKSVFLHLDMTNNGCEANFLSTNDLWKQSGPCNSSMISYGDDQLEQYVDFYYHFRRRYEVYVVSVLVPSMLLIAMVMATGFMAPEPPRVVCCIMLVLAQAVSQASVNDVMPKSADVTYLHMVLTMHMGTGVTCSIYTILACELVQWPAFKRLITPKTCKFRTSVIRLVDIVFFTSTNLFLLLFDSHILRSMLN